MMFDGDKKQHILRRDMYSLSRSSKCVYWAKGEALATRLASAGGEPWEDVSLLGCVLVMVAFILICAMLGFMALGWAAISFLWVLEASML